MSEKLTIDIPPCPEKWDDNHGEHASLYFDVCRMMADRSILDHFENCDMVAYTHKYDCILVEHVKIVSRCLEKKAYNFVDSLDEIHRGLLLETALSCNTTYSNVIDWVLESEFDSSFHFDVALEPHSWLNPIAKKHENCQVIDTGLRSVHSVCENVQKLLDSKCTFPNGHGGSFPLLFLILDLDRPISDIRRIWDMVIEHPRVDIHTKHSPTGQTVFHRCLCNPHFQFALDILKRARTEINDSGARHVKHREDAKIDEDGRARWIRLVTAKDNLGRTALEDYVSYYSVLQMDSDFFLCLDELLHLEKACVSAQTKYYKDSIRSIVDGQPELEDPMFNVLSFLDGAETPLGALVDGGKSISDIFLDEVLFPGDGSEDSFDHDIMVREFVRDDGSFCEPLRYRNLPDELKLATYELSLIEKFVQEYLPDFQKLDRYYR